MKTITLLSKFWATSAKQLKLPLLPTLLVSTQTSFFEICTNGLPFIFLIIFCFQDLFSKFSDLLLLLEPEGRPWEHFLFSFDQDRLPRAMEKITIGGPHCQLWNLVKRKSFPSKKKKKIKYEPGSWNFFNFIISLWNVKQMFWDNNFFPFAHNSWIQIIFSKPCHMLDKRRLGNSGETYHIIESVLVVW